MSERTYTEEEVAALFKRASELQAERDASSNDPGASHGLTLDELAAIASDAGLDPELLRAAAAEMGRPGRRSKAPQKVSGSEIVAERWIPGMLDDLSKEDLITELRHRFDMPSWQGTYRGYGKSTVENVGRSIEWHHFNPIWGTETRVLIQPREGETRIRVSQKNVYTGAATGWSTYYGPLLALTTGLLTGMAAGFVFGIAATLLTLIVLTPLFRKMSSRAEERSRRAVEEIAEMIASHAEPVQKAAVPAERESSERESRIVVADSDLESDPPERKDRVVVADQELESDSSEREGRIEIEDQGLDEESERNLQVARSRQRT